MSYNHVFFISPPFYSHFSPLLVLAKSFIKYGKKVTFGCSVEFKHLIEESGMDFYTIDISNNKNTGKAEDTNQPDSEKERLEAFFESTKIGAIETLITQSKHRKEDMLYNPEMLIEKIKRIDEELSVDMFVVDVLSYGVTLALYACNRPFITFCPPHPNTIPEEGGIYGVPKKWPSRIKHEVEKLDRLEEVAMSTQTEFTEVFNSVISNHRKGHREVVNAFSLVSETAIIYNYADFYQSDENITSEPYKIYMGHCFEEKSLDQFWMEKIRQNQMKILITLGTFLSNRIDVLQKLIIGCKKHYPDAVFYVSAGIHVENLKPYLSKKDFISSFLPQIGLMPHMDLVIHHGGCNTFTEALYYGIPMIILPFSSDQFNIAYDAENNGVAEVLDPNSFVEEDLFEALQKISTKPMNQLNYWSEVSKMRGPDYVVKILLGMHNKEI